jgi:hypothetical protein
VIGPHLFDSKNDWIVTELSLARRLDFVPDRTSAPHPKVTERASAACRSDDKTGGNKPRRIPTPAAHHDSALRHPLQGGQPNADHRVEQWKASWEICMSGTIRRIDIRRDHVAEPHGHET